jgi:hypothetical protein
MNKELFVNNDEEVHSSSEIPKEERKLDTTSYDYAVDYLVHLMREESKKIILVVPFQRKYIWKDDRASLLIESIIMNVPIPPLYFSEELDNNWLVIDGLQRLTAILKFYKNEFALKNLKIVKELEGKKYEELPHKSKRLLDTGLMRVIVVRNSSHADIKYDVFMRLNQGAVSLTHQELRNCLYRGKLIDIAKELVASNRDFLDILGLEKPDDRFADVEFVLRFFALHNCLIPDEPGKYRVNSYTNSFGQFINSYLSSHQNPSRDEMVVHTRLFNDTIAKVVSVFGVEHAFRDLSAAKKSKKVNKVNRAIADFILLSFARFPQSQLDSKKPDIIQLLIHLIETDETFRESLLQRSYTKRNLEYRINTWMANLHDLLSS